jgi:Type IIA topoisomerase (DNA gyrase/topo II, topoisomerase IV), A subunit
MGIAVGMATNIPPHNVVELIDALKLILRKDKVSLSEILKIINGPDLPTGGSIILETNEKKEIYKYGKGSFTINSQYQIEELKNGLYQIVVTEIPFQVNKVKIIEQLANNINNKKLPLDDVVDESDENIRIVLRPKTRNINAKKLISLCFKLTDLSIKYSCNFNVLIDGLEPKQVGIIEILSNFLQHKKISIKRKFKFLILEKLKKNAGRFLKGLSKLFFKKF